MKIIKKLFLVALSAGLLSVPSQLEKVEAASITAGTKLYLKSSNQWANNMINKGGTGKERYSAYFYGNGEAWVSMADSNSDGIWEVTSPNKTFTNVIFCAMNPKTSTNDWNNKWNQTNDLTYDGVNNLYTIKEGTWDKGGGTWTKYTEPGEEVKPYETLTGIISNFQNGGYYIRKSEIYLNEAAVNDLLKLDQGFHNDASELVRTTYFEGNQLWMTGEDINSGYGTTNDGKMNHFTYKNGVKEVDYTVSESTGMENWYQTMMDLKITEDQIWEVNNEVYSSKNEQLIEWFKAFTAPCYKGFKEDLSNYINFDHVEIQKSTDESTLSLRLFAKSTSSGSLTTNDGDESTPDLFSEAKVSLHSNATIAGSFNGWNTTANWLHTTDKSDIYTTEITFKAGATSFKVVNGAEWIGHSQLKVSGVTVKNDADDNCVFTAEAATYQFKYTKSSKTLVITKL